MRHKGAIIVRWTMVLPLVAAVLFLGSKTIRIPSSSQNHPREPRRELRRSSSHTPRLTLLNNETQSIVSEARSDKQSALDQLSELRAEISEELEDQEAEVFGKDLPEIALERAKAFSAMIKRRLAWMEEKLQEGSLAEVEDSVAIWTAEPAPVALGAGTPGMRTMEEKELQPKMTPRIRPAHGGVEGEPSLKPPAPSRGDTSATLEIDLESEILQELAENLDHDPRRILEYVQGHMRYEPYVGSMRGAEETYLTGAGNDVDQASLMMALLRISGIPCRYVEGVIRLKTERVMDWMGVQTAMAAARVFKVGAIPYVPINGAGPDGVESFDIDHVWVEAYVGVQNYRGAPGDGRGKIWVPLAPAIKEMEARGSVNVIEEMAASGTPFEAEDFFDAYIERLERQSPVAVFEDSVVTYLSDAHPGMSIEEAKRKLSIKGKSYPILPLSLPAKILAVRGEYDECPEDWRFKVKVKAYVGSDTLLSAELALPAVGTRCMVLGFKPETEADAEILIRYGGVYGAPAYLVRVTPVLRLQGETVAYGEGGIGLGKEYKVWFRVEGPKGVLGEQEMRKTAGMQWGVGIVSGRVPGVLDRVRRGGNSEGLHGRELHELVMRYWEGAWGEQERFGELWWTRVMNEPDVSLTSTRLLVDKVYGQPVGVSWCGLYVNVHARVGIVELAREVSDRDVVWRGMVFVGMGTLSWMEHRIFEEKYKVSAISGVLALERGIEQGVGVYDVDSTNVESQLGLMDLPVWAEERIRGYVHGGYKVKAVGEEVTQGEWEGVGYMCWKERGEGGYIIQRDLGGGETTEPFIWGGWNTFWMVVCGWQNYYPDIGEEADEAIPCDLCSTRVEWEDPPDSSVWAWGDSIAVSRYDTLFWEGHEEPEVLGPDTCWFRTWEHDPDLWTFRAQIFGIYPDAPPGLEEEPIWYFGGDTLRFWTVKVEPDTTQSSMLFEVPLEGEEGVKDTAQTVFTILPDTSFFESPTMESLKYWHYVTRETEGGVVDTVKSKVRFGLDSLEVHEVSGDPYWVKKWLQQDDAHEWLDPADNPFESHIRMEWVNRDEETRQTTRHNNDEEHEAEGIGIDLVVYLANGSELPEDVEQGAGSGMFVKLNDDYDAGQEIPDWELEQVPGENDLVRIKIKPTFDEQGELVQVGKLTLEIAKAEGGGGGMGDLIEKVKIWKHREKGSGNLLIGGEEDPSKTWDLTSGEDVEELMKFVGSEPSETLWVEGCKEPSERLKDWRLVLTLEDEQGSKAEEDEVEGTVMRVNLEIPGLIEKDETKVGCFVLYNDDDDNCNRVKDKDESGPIVANANINVSKDEDNLVRARMIVEPLSTVGRAQLMTISNRLRLWSRPSKGPGNEIQLHENVAEWDLGDGSQRETYLSLTENVWIEGYRAAQCIRDAGLLLRYVAEGSEANWLADTVRVSVGRLNVYVPEWYPWSHMPTPEPFRLQVVAALEAGDSAFSNVAFVNTGEWYRLQTELGSEPDTVDGIPLPQGFSVYEHLDPVRFPRVVVRPDVFESWGIQIDGWIAKAGAYQGAHHRDYWYTKDPGVYGLWNANWSAHFWEGIMGTCRMVATLSSPYGTLNSPVLEYCTRTSFRGHFPNDANGRPFLAWATTFLEVPYEWGGYWYGGRIDRNTGGGWAYDGYGIDCSGLISAAAYWAGYRWTEWRLNTTGLVSVSDPISAADAQPGDILNKPGAHVVAIIRRDPGSPLIDIIEASPWARKVRVLTGQDILVHYVNQGYVPRRLRP